MCDNNIKPNLIAILLVTNVWMIFISVSPLDFIVVFDIFLSHRRNPYTVDYRYQNLFLSRFYLVTFRRSKMCAKKVMRWK